MNFSIPNNSGASASVPNAGVVNIGASSSSNSVFNKVDVCT